MAGQCAGLQRLVNVSNGSFHQMEGVIGRAIGEGHKQKSKNGREFFCVHEYQSNFI
jgi:hypothetical protein